MTPSCSVFLTVKCGLCLLGKNPQHDTARWLKIVPTPTFQGDDDVCQGGVNFLDVGVAVDPGAEDLCQHPGGLSPLLLSPPDITEDPQHHLPSRQFSEPEAEAEGRLLAVSLQSGAAASPDDSLQDTADGAESPESGDPDVES